MQSGFDAFLSALALSAGYNSALVTVGSALLGASGGAAGAFLFLRKRALVSDAVSHSTLPGVALAFIVMALAGGDGRWLPGLLAGSALSAGLGLWLVERTARVTRLSEDAAIGAVLSTFFGFGIVLLTVIQNLDAGKAAGLEGFLLGQTAGMLRSEALTIAVAGALAAAAAYALRRPMTLVCFDPDYAATTGVNVRRTDLAMMGLALAVTVIGLKIVGLVLIVALLIVPAVAARFWTDRVDALALIAAGIGAVSGYVGAAISAAASGLPTGPIIVLVAFTLFVLSLTLSPRRGVLAALLRHLAFRRKVHLRQGLLALARGEPIYERYTLVVLRRAGYIRADGVATLDGRAAAAKALRDEARWAVLRAGGEIDAGREAQERYDGLTPIETVLTRDQIERIDAQLRPEAAT